MSDLMPLVVPAPPQSISANGVVLRHRSRVLRGDKRIKMNVPVIDIHPHIISDDQQRYPHAPIFGERSEWSRHQSLTIEQLIEAMDEAGVRKAAVVQPSTCYGYDNSYVADATAHHSDRFTGVGAIDMAAPDAEEKIRYWVGRNLSGVRLFTGGGSTKSFDNNALDDPASFPAWALCTELGLPVCIQTVPSGHAQVAGMAKRFPGVNIILDHLGRPDVQDGPPYNGARSLFALSAFENIYLKLTPRGVREARKAPASCETFFPKLVSVFGANRIAWGSNHPATAGVLKENLYDMKIALSSLTDSDRDAIFSTTAQKLYPSLRD
ncbi:amidohydrolase family protein [Shinella sp.]|uniref:amidohydrolase family protein n=1 Tax=Shinella sp. TaxID=1870904 RepID=UPI003F6FA365